MSYKSFIDFNLYFLSGFGIFIIKNKDKSG